MKDYLLQETIDYKNHKIKIYYDEDPSSPDDWDMLGTFYHSHRKYIISKNRVDIGYWEEDEIKELLNNSIYVPVYMYDHSGITINTTGFSCGWDSGQIGFYLVSKENIRKEYSCKKISKKLKDRVIQILTNEIESWDTYLIGDVFGYVVEDQDGEIIDSCYGFYGNDHEKSGLLEYARDFIDCEIKKIHKPDPNQQELNFNLELSN